MNQFYCFTNTIKPSLAQKIVNELESLRSWKDVMRGIGGVVVNEKSISRLNLSAEKLSTMTVPNAAKFELLGESKVSCDHVKNIPEPVGSQFSLPKDIGSMLMCIRTYNGKKRDTHFNYECKSSLYDQAGFLNKYPLRSHRIIEMHSVTFYKTLKKYKSYEWLKSIEGQMDVLSDEIEYVSNFFRICGLPVFPYKCLAEPHNLPSLPLPDGIPNGVEYCRFNCDPSGDSLGFKLHFDPQILPEWIDVLKKYQVWLRKNNQPYEISSSVNYGGMNWFGGAVGCVTDEAIELIQRECANPQYDSYDMSYMKLEPETWVKRESRRKKLTVPAFQQLGECKLENGCKITVRLKMLKEGYVIYLDFPSDDDMIKFSETQVYRMTKWENSAE
jgi:hypothetical protein